MKRRTGSLFIAFLYLWVSCSLAAAQVLPRHPAMKMQGFELRGEIPFAKQRVTYQDIVPCRLVDTRADSAFDAAHGAPRFSPGEARFYTPSGPLPDVDGCSLAARRLLDPDAAPIPAGIVALAVRVSAINDQLPPEGGVVVVGADGPDAPGSFAFWFGYAGSDVANLQEAMVAVEEPGDVFRVSARRGRRRARRCARIFPDRIAGRAR